MEAIAEQIRALIAANAPGLSSVTDGLPDVAIVAAGPAALLIVLILLFMILGALGGGKKKKERREEIVREVQAQDDIPRPAPTRAAPQAPAAPKAPAKPADSPALDRRGEQLLEAIRHARAPEAEPLSSEQKLQQEEAAGRLVRDHAAVVRLIMSGEVRAGFDKLAEEAAGFEKSKKPKAAQAYRDIAVLMDGIDNKQALDAAESAFAIEKNNFWGAIFLARLRAAADKPRDALDAAHAAVEAAKGPREKAVAQAEYGDANLRIGRIDIARESYKSAIDATRTLARSGETRAQHDLSVCLNKLGDLEVQAKDVGAARALFEEDLTIARHLAKAEPQSAEAQRDVIISLVKLAEVSGDRNHWVEASQSADALARSGRMPQSDAWMVEALRKQVAALQQQ